MLINRLHCVKSCCSRLGAFRRLISRRRGPARRSPPRTASRQLMPSSWRMASNAGSRSFRHRKSLRTTVLPKFKLLRLTRAWLPNPQTQGRRRASTRAPSLLPHHGVIATGSTFALSPSSHASSAVAGRLTRIIFVICSRARSAAKPAMNSPYRSVGFIIARCIAPATSELGGRRPASIRSGSPASCGKTPASMRGG